jgi:hypothetical protein
MPGQHSPHELAHGGFIFSDQDRLRSFQRFQCWRGCWLIDGGFDAREAPKRSGM